MKCTKCGKEMVMILQEKSSMKIERIYRCSDVFGCGNISRSLMLTDKSKYLEEKW